MKLPTANEADVPRAKIVLYLLNPDHRSGKGKAIFFSSQGFTVERWQELADALRRHSAEHEVTRREPTSLGAGFVVEGPMRMPTGAVANIRSVWLIESGESMARLVTAYPLRNKKRL